MLVKNIDMSQKEASCPECGKICKKHSNGSRKIKDLEHILVIKYSKHYCPTCCKYFNIYMEHLAPKGSSYSNKVQDYVKKLISKFNYTYKNVNFYIRSEFDINIPITTICEWACKEKGE